MKSRQLNPAGPVVWLVPLEVLLAGDGISQAIIRFLKSYQDVTDRMFKRFDAYLRLWSLT